jgi:hypothetical protein
MGCGVPIALGALNLSAAHPHSPVQFPNPSQPKASDPRADASSPSTRHCPRPLSKHRLFLVWVAPCAPVFFQLFSSSLVSFTSRLGLDPFRPFRFFDTTA